MSTGKPWERPWSMDEIIENSDKWNLAGDVALLNTLQAFADKLLQRTNEINNNLQNLTNKLDETSLQLNIAQNEFQNLRNSQFIESRVYEDDESLPQNEEKTVVEEKNDDHTEDIRSAAVKGLEVLEEFFDKVEVSVSDSEDEDIDLPNYVLRPKDLYINRPLPYVIGSEEWHKKWHVGLEDSSSDSETEKVSDNFSESDSESDLPIIQDRSQIKGTSDTSSELDFSQKIEPKIGRNDFFNSSDSENSGPAQGPLSSANFAEQLAAKLGHVITQEYQEPEVNRRPIKTQQTNYGDIFFDEPPPLDEPKGMFSGGGGLFDDDDENAPYSAPKEAKIGTPKPKAGLFDDSDEDIFKKSPQNAPKTPLFSEEPPALDEKKKPVGGVSIFGGGNLFDKKLLRQASSDDEEEKEKKVDLFGGDLFKSSPDKAPVVSSKSVKKINLFDSDEEEATKGLFGDNELEKEKEKDEKLGDEKPSKKISLFDDDEKITKEKEGEEKPVKKMSLFGEKIEEKEQESEEKPVKKISLFDDDDLFKEDLFSSNSTKKFTSGLFEDIPGDDLFSTKFEEKPSSGGLFDDLVATPNKKSINSDSNLDKTNPGNKIADVSGKKPVSFDENNLFSSSPKENEFSESKTGENVEKSEENNLFGSIGTISKPPLPKPRLSLFDSPPPEPDDLFGVIDSPHKISSDLFTASPPDAVASSSHAPSTGLFAGSPPKLDFIAHSDFPPTTGSASTSPSHSSDLFDKSPKKSSTPQVTPTPIPNVRLFDQSPPPDDDWDRKSDNLSENDDFINDFEDLKTQKTDLFSEEPPSLDFREEKETKSKPGKLKHNLNINVGALMPGYVPPKRGDGAAKPSNEETSSGDVTKTSSDDVTKMASEVPRDAPVTSFDETDKVDVLQSVTKDRAKVPLNRRPSTRRGRKEALRRSTSEFKLEKEKTGGNESESSPEKSKSDDFVEKKPVISEYVSKVLEKEKNYFEDASEGDLFTVSPERSLKPEIPKSITEPASQLKKEEKNPPKIEKEEKNLPKIDKEEKKSSSESPHLDAPKKPQPKGGLFDDDDEDDLFTTKKSAHPTKPKKSLFDDDDDEDIFKSFSSPSAKKTHAKTAPEKKIPKASSVKKLENTKPDDDPLSALLK